MEYIIIYIPDNDATIPIPETNPTNEKVPIQESLYIPIEESNQIIVVDSEEVLNETFFIARSFKFKGEHEFNRVVKKDLNGVVYADYVDVKDPVCESNYKLQIESKKSPQTVYYTIISTAELYNFSRERSNYRSWILPFRNSTIDCANNNNFPIYSDFTTVAANELPKLERDLKYYDLPIMSIPYQEYGETFTSREFRICLVKITKSREDSQSFYDPAEDQMEVLDILEYETGFQLKGREYSCKKYLASFTDRCFLVPCNIKKPGANDGQKLVYYSWLPYWRPEIVYPNNIDFQLLFDHLNVTMKKYSVLNSINIVKNQNISEQIVFYFSSQNLSLERNKKTITVDGYDCEINFYENHLTIAIGAIHQCFLEIELRMMAHKTDDNPVVRRHKCSINDQIRFAEVVPFNQWKLHKNSIFLILIANVLANE